MEVFRIAVTLVLLTGSFWEDIANIFKRISTKKKKINNNNNTKKETITIRPQAQIIDGNNAVHERDIINIIAKNEDDMNENNCDDFHILADDMMRKILSQLPPETMMKCKSVSRSWRRLIIEGCSFLIEPRRDPYPLSGLIICRKGTFMTLSPERDMFYCLLPLRDRGSMITPKGILSYKDRLIQPNNLVMAESFLQHLPLSSLHHDFREILDCCNGLLLFRDSNLGNSSSLTTPPCYVIGNPTTSEFVKIPGEIIDTNFASGALAYDPSESLHYKVVIIIGGQSKSNLLKIFSSDTLRWTKSYFNLENTGTLEVQSYQSIYSGGILYKLSTSGQLIRIFTETNIVQSVDLPMVRFADRINRKSECIGITSDGRLNYALLADSELKIFILGGSNTNDLNWSLNLHQKLDRFCTPRCQFMWPKVYAFHPQNPGNIFMCCEIIEDGCCTWRTNTFMICYNYKTHNIQEHAHLDPRLLTGISNTFAFPFTRSLLPLSSSQGRIPYQP